MGIMQQQLRVDVVALGERDARAQRWGVVGVRRRSVGRERLQDHACDPCEVIARNAAAEQQCEFAVRRPLVLVHGDRRIALDRLGPGRRHTHPIRLRGAAPGPGEIVLRTFSYRDVTGRVADAGGTTLAVAVTACRSRVTIWSTDAVRESS